MVENIVLIFILILLLLILFYTLAVYIEKIVKGFNKINTKSFANRKVFSFSWNALRNDIVIWLVLDSRKKWGIFIFSISSILLVLLTDYSKTLTSDPHLKMLSMVLMFNVLYGIGYFIYYPFKDFLFYFIKFLLLVVYTSVLFQSYLENLDSLFILFIAIFVTIIYSFAFARYIIERVKPYLIQFLHFIIIILYDIIIIGFSFGFYYLNNYGEFTSFFNITDYEQTLNNIDLPSYFLIFYYGIIPFYIFPNELSVGVGIESFVPLIEYLIGYMFNIFVIGFIVSYSVSKLAERSSKS